MERTKILYGNDRLDQLNAANNSSRSRLVVFSFECILNQRVLFYRSNLQLPLTSEQQSQLSDNKQLSSNEQLTDEITPTRPDMSFT
jgi:hypothetical protein